MEGEAGVTAGAEKQRAANLKKRYGISIEQYEKLLAAQDGRCAICRKAPGRQRLGVDHDHRTKKVRGLLCNYCNRRLIGRFRQADLFLAAYHYLDKPPADEVLGSTTSAD